MKAFSNIVRKYYKRVYTPFEQPALTSAGTIGGGAWAVQGLNGNRGTDYTAVYPQTGLYGAYSKGGAPWVGMRMYTPQPTIITGVEYNVGWSADGNIKVNFEASTDNGATWFNLYPQTLLSINNTSLTFDNQKAYQYYQLIFQTTGGGYHDGADMKNIKLIGNVESIQEATPDGYEWYSDVKVYSAFKIDDKYYCQK